MSRATLNDVVEDLLRLELGYGEEFSVNNEVGTLYDADETENLTKRLSDLGIKGDSFLTVIDDDDENPRVNLILSVQESATPMGDKPIKSLDIIKPAEGEFTTSPIPRRKKVVPDVESNGHGTKDVPNSNPGKRTASDAIQDGSPLTKRPKTTLNGMNGSPAKAEEIVIDDSANGAILIDDD